MDHLPKPKHPFSSQVVMFLIGKTSEPTFKTNLTALGWIRCFAWTQAKQYLYTDTTEAFPTAS